MNAFLQERFTGIRIVQLFNREEADLERFKFLNNDYLDAHLRSITYYALFYPIIQVLTAVALALIIWYGGGAMVQGAVTIGVLAAFLDYARRFYRPIQDLSDKYNLLQGAMASSERIFRLLDREPAIRNPPRPACSRSPLPERSASRTYGSRTGGDDADGGEADWVLRDVSFTVAPGEKLAIVGHTGGRQDIPHQPADALLRAPAGIHPGGRRAGRAPAHAGPQGADRTRPAGHFPVQPVGVVQRAPGLGLD